MRIASWSLNAATVALAGYCIGGLGDGSGPAGWINQAQTALFGSSSMRFTAVVLLFAIAMLYGIGATFVPTGGRSRSPFANRLLFGPSRRRAPRGRSARSLAAACAALVAAAWAIGYGVWWWTATERRDAAGADGFATFVVLCTAISAAIVLVFAIAGWHVARAQRETFMLPPRRAA